MVKPYLSAGTPLRTALMILLLALASVGAHTSSEQQGETEEEEADAGEADERLDDIIVVSDRILVPTRQADEAVYTGTEITRAGIEARGARATTSVYEAVSVLPGVHAEAADAYGLGAEQRYIRVRGVRGFLGALTLEGVPNYGGNPIGPRDYVYDMENIEAISVYKGAVPGDIGTGVGSRGGALALRPLWPGDRAGFRLAQSIGTDTYLRTSLRLEAGSLPGIGTALSGSYSFSRADKWRGPGAIGPRHNFNLSMAQPIGELVDLKIWLNHNDLAQDLFRPLSHDAVGTLSDSYYLDFNEGWTGTPADDILYYDYNRGRYRNTDVLAVVTVTPRDDLRLSLKPYLAAEDSEIFQGVPSGGGILRRRVRDINRAGAISEAAWAKGSWGATFGYLFETADMNISAENYGIEEIEPEYRGMGLFATTGRTSLHSPYLKLAGSIGDVDWQAGLKYFWFRDAASEGFVSPPPDFTPQRAPDLDRGARTHDILLPTVAVGYTFTTTISAYASYGRTFIRPYMYMPLIGLYNNNRETFLDAGVDLDELFAGYDIEESDTIDLGVRLSKETFEFAPTLFLGKHRNLMTTVYDPRVELNYLQNVGRATGYGLDLEMSLFPRDGLTLFLNPTYTVLKYDDDLVFRGHTLQTRGRQLVDTPSLMVRAGAMYRLRDVEVIPSIRFTGARYGDVEHEERVGSYVVGDLKGGYTFRDLGFENTVRVSLELNNIWNTRYVSSITASDFNRGGAASYYPGAPFSAILSLSLEI